MQITSEDIKAELQYRLYNKIEYIFRDDGEFSRDKYIKHMEFIESTATYRQCCMMAANRVGKSELGCYIVTSHLTGIYPSWWNGKKFKKPVRVRVSGETGELVRDSLQIKLLGKISAIGTGLIKKNLIDSRSMRSGVRDAVDTAYIKHISGGLSELKFQSYDQGREKFQATASEVELCDEEPPLDVYEEILLRTMTTNGVVLSTFTPLKGVSETVLYLQDQQMKGNAKIITATWDDAPHLSEESKKQLFDALPPHQRDARSKGVPTLGSGAIYPVLEERFVVDPFPLPKHWRFAYGLDVGWNNTAACWGALDPETDVLYIYSDYKQGRLEPPIHASSIQARGKWIPGAIDPASRGRSQKDGEQLIKLYRDAGLNITEADNGVESGLFDVYQRIVTGKLKVFNTCTSLLSEYRIYRRDDKGKPVKDNDHIMDALRYLVKTGIKIATQEITVAPSSVSMLMEETGSWMG